MRILLATSLLVLAGCSTHQNKAASHHPHAEVTLASHGGASHCAKPEMASAEGKSCHMKKVEMASTSEGKQCSSKKVEMASTSEGKQCSSKKVEMASTSEGKQCSSKKAEMASTEGKQCSTKKAEMASTETKAGCHGATTAVLASADTTPHCENGCPKKADGSCDHEAGAKDGRECCQSELAKAN